MDALAEKTGLSKKDCDAVSRPRTCTFQCAAAVTICMSLERQVLGASLDTIADAVADGKKVTFLGFGSFEPRARAARAGRNPKTGEPLEIKASISPGFSASKSFKDKVNGRA